MKIYVNCADGSILEYVGLANHISARSHLERIGFELFPGVAIPSGDYSGDNLLCVRMEDEEYESGKYDVAEWDD